MEILDKLQREATLFYKPGAMQGKGRNVGRIANMKDLKDVQQKGWIDWYTARVLCVYMSVYACE